MKALSSVIVLGLGLLMVAGSPARAQYGDMGDTLKKGATDAAKQEIMKGTAEKAGLAKPEAPAAVPAADTGAAAAAVGEPKAAPETADAPATAPDAGTGAGGASAVEPKVAPGAEEAPAAAAGSDTGAASVPAGESKAAPAAADAPAGIPGAAGTMRDAAVRDAGGKMQKMMPKVP